MKFGIYLVENRIAEWKVFYINYESLKAILNPLKKNMKKDKLLLIKRKELIEVIQLIRVH